MDNLPHEIIRDIFLETVVESRNDFLDHCKRRELGLRPTDTIPLTLSHVCRIWRNVVLSFGELWSFFSFEYHGSMELEIFKTCLRRTNGYPLDFTISIGTTSEYPSMELAYEHLRMTEEIIDMMFSQQHRWRDVRLVLDCDRYSSTFASIQADNMPLLRSLSLSWVYDGMRKAVIDVAKSARLRSLALKGRYRLKFGDKPIYTLTERIDLDLSSEFSSEIVETTCLNLLKTAPNLKQLRVHLYSRIDKISQKSVDETQNRVVHDLRSLSFSGCTMPFSRVEVSFRSLNALHFTELAVSPLGQLLADFVGQFTPSLTFLHIGFWIDSQLLITTLCLLPTLRALRIMYSDASRMMPFLEALTLEGGNEESRDDTLSNPNDRIVCPYLHSLSIGVDLDVRDVFFITLRTMLESRHRILNTFQRLRTRCDYVDYVLKMPFTEEDCADFERSVMGIEVTILAEGDEAEPNPFGSTYWY